MQLRKRSLSNFFAEALEESMEAKQARIPGETNAMRRARGWMLIRKALPNDIRQARIKGQVEAII